MMDFTTYQHLAARTASPDADMEKRRLIAALGLTGEAGEVAELIKKEIGHGHPPEAAKVAKELGDVLWYAALLATTSA
jgi:NTP pyrophosphatase (non-canonical NTP hydrolase)